MLSENLHCVRKMACRRHFRKFCDFAVVVIFVFTCFHVFPNSGVCSYMILGNQVNCG